MTARDLSEMSSADLQRWLKHYRSIKVFWDTADRNRVAGLIGELETEISRRGGTP